MKMASKIEEEFLDQGDFFIAEWSNGYTFHLADRVEKLFMRKYKESFSEISSGSNMGSVKIEDSTNDDYLCLDTDDAEFLHGNVGVYPKDARLYWILPNQSGVAFSFPNVDAPSPSNGDDYACLDGRRSSIEEPTDFMSVSIPPKFHPAVDVYNPYSDDKYPMVSLRFAHYITRVVDFHGKEDIVRELFSPSIDKTKKLVMGDKSNPASLSKTQQKDWGVEPLDVAEFHKILAGGSVESVKVETGGE